MNGSARNVPSLVPSSATSAGEGNGKRKRSVVPKGALPPETRGKVGLFTPPKAVTAALPVVTSTSPPSGGMVTSLDPVLSASATTTSGSADFDFEVCDNVSSDPSVKCVSSGWISTGGLSAQWTPPAGTLKWARQYWWSVDVKDSAAVGGITRSGTHTFTVGGRSQVAMSQISTTGVDGTDFHPLTGNYTTSVTDVEVPVAGPPLGIRRSYNSSDPRRDSSFGAGWSSNLDMRATKEFTNRADAPTSLTVTYPDGRLVRFPRKPDGKYVPPPGMFATLADETGGGWKLMDKGSTTYLFDTQGRLTKISDQRGVPQEFVYGADGKLSMLRAAGGRTLRFTWSGAHIGTVSTDPVGGSPLTWTYTYTGDHLSKVCDPQQRCTSYEYTGGSLYRTMVADSDPFGYWRLGEATGTQAKDQARIATSGTYTGAVLGRPGALTGTPDTAVELGAGAKVTMPEGILTAVGVQASLEVWFKTTGSGPVLSTDGIRGDHPLIAVDPDGRLSAAYDPLRGPRAVSPGPVNDGAWHHAVLTVDGQWQTLYLDGAAVYVSSASEQIQARPKLVLGGAAGSYDELAVYDYALPHTDVARHHAAGAGVGHKLAKLTLPSGRVQASNTYDAATDRLLTHTDRHGGTWRLDPLVYTPVTGRSSAKVTDPQNETLGYTFDAWRAGRLVSRTDQLGKTVAYEYDTGGFPRTITDANGNVTEYLNDSRGNRMESVTCRAAGNCQTTYVEHYLNRQDPFDVRNDRVIRVGDARSASEFDTTYSTTADYSRFGELIAQTTPATPGFPNGRSVHTSYTDGTEPAVGGGTTPAGLAETKTDARGSVWTYRYTSAGDLAEQADPAGLVTKLEYDALGRLTGSTLVSAAHPGGVKTVFTYDLLGRLVTQTEPGVKNEVSGLTHTKKTTFAYDPDGNKLSETVTDLTGGEAARETVFTYDTRGRLETTTGPEGGVVRQAWNTLGQLSQLTDARGTVTENGYTKRGELLNRTLKGWTGSPTAPQPARDVVLESYGYDPAGRLATQVDAMGRQTSFTYYGDNRLHRKTATAAKLNGATTPRDVVLEEHTYDAAGNRTKLVAGGGSATTEYVYDAAGLATSQVFDPAGLKRKTAFAHDANGNVLKQTHTGTGARMEAREFTYNKANQVLKETVENGADDLVSTLAYDDRGLVVASTDPRGNAAGATPADFTTSMRYDALGRLVEATGPMVKVDKAGASADARPVARLGYDTMGATTHKTDAEGRTLTSVFDRAGRLTSLKAPAYTPPGGTPVTPTTVHAYDAAGQLVRTTDPRGNITGFDYDQLGRQVRVSDPAPQGQPSGQTVVEYDLAGEKLATVDPTGARTEATYDDLGRMITATQIERKPSTAAHTTTMEYNDAGALTKQTAPGNRTTIMAVNAAGEIDTQTDPASNKTLHAYDLAGRLTKTTDPEGNATTVEYDLAGRQTKAQDLNTAGAVVRTATTGYDAVGNPTSATSPEGHVTRQTYDALNRLTTRVEPVSATESITTGFGYDATGARTRLTDGRGNATWTTYNTLGLLESVTEPATTAHPNPADRTWTSVYDPGGNPVTSLLPGGVRIDRVFDHLGRLTKETGAGGGAATAERTIGYDLAGRATALGDLTVDYNDRGLPLTVKRGTAQQTGYTYDALGNPTQRVDAAGTAAFTWDTAGRLATATDPVTDRTLTYGYDKASRLTSLTGKTSAGAAADAQTFTYDAVDRLDSHTLKNATGTQLAKITYGWDKDDNLTTKTTAGLAGAGTNTYTYDHAGRLTSWTAPTGTRTDYGWDASGNRVKAGSKTFTYDQRNRLTTGDGTDYTYTPRGTLATETKNGQTTNLTFDAFDRLIADGDSLYSYDALNRVTTRTRGTAKQTFAYSGLGNDLAAITDTTTGATLNKYGRDVAGGILSLQEGNTPATTALSDLHGDLVATFTTTGIQTSTAYDPFGTPTAQTGAKSSLGYQGEYTDPDTGKVNMHARWYQPGTGAFTSRDTATLNPSPSVQANRYTYANASPLTGIDPTGHATASTGLTGGNLYTGSGYGYSFSGAGIVLTGVPESLTGLIGGGLGGGEGAIGCAGPATNLCGAADFSALAEADPEWYFENFVKYRLPSFDDAEARRIGVMPNGMPAPPGFYKLSARQRAEFSDFASMMNFLNPSISLEQLIGGVAPSGGAIGDSSSKGSYYERYKNLLPYWRDIQKAAKKHKVSKYALTAVLIWETANAGEGVGRGGAFLAFMWESTKGRHRAWGASIGIAQMEIYKGTLMLIKHEGRKWARTEMRYIIKEMLKPARAIDLAAAWLAHLKQNIRINGRPIDDFEAAYAYCGCSGVVTWDGRKFYYPVPRYEKFAAWLSYHKSNDPGKRNPLQGGNAAEADRRARELDAMTNIGGNDGVVWEFWSCVEERDKRACG
ncbi:RHS repeat-associated core domain-containing protein [Nonomuraea longicatena]